MTSEEFSKAAKRKPLAIVPFGSVEEHGSHLPLCTDAFQAEEVARRIALEFDGLLLPPIRYGECRSTRNFPGTVSLSFDSMRSIASDIVSELGRNGIDKIVLISGHAGSAHLAALREGAMSALNRYPGIKVMVLSDYEIVYDLRGKEYPESDGHAGQIETSRMLNIRAELVRDSRPVGSTRAPKFMLLSDPERHFPSGVMGDSRGASAKKGKRLDDYVVEKLSQSIRTGFGLDDG
ncbi:MAG TPA: creatininase family protein [Thermoplasmata archaeon]|nr:creatininase family protein [Thermoplasmata archaeon]